MAALGETHWTTSGWHATQQGVCLDYTASYSSNTGERSSELPKPVLFDWKKYSMALSKASQRVLRDRQRAAWPAGIMARSWPTWRRRSRIYAAIMRSS